MSEKVKEREPITLFLKWIASAAIVFLVILCAGCKKKRMDETSDFKAFLSALKPLEIENMNIVIFTIDTLRADHLECYGYEKVKTPNIDRLADEGIRFEYNIAQAPLTLPSHSTIFTGTYPLYHGIRDNGGFYLDDKHVTLAEVLKNKGFSTGAFVAAFVLDSRWGLDQGFDFYYDNFDLTKYRRPSLDAVQRRGEEVLEEAYQWIEKQSQGRFFAWIHLYDPHTPYDPPEPYKSQYMDRQYGLYDGEIAYVDRLMGEFRQFMENRGLLEKTVIIFTADHGESLGEHQESAHGFFIYDAAVRIPLIFRFPERRFAGQVVTQQVRSLDILPTVLDIIGEESPECVQGESLLGLILGRDERPDLPAYSETYWPNYHYGWSELKSYRTGQYKFIDAPKPELYDIIADPGELNNLISAQAAFARKMEKDLAALLDNFSAEGIEETGPRGIDQDSLEKLQALGYIGTFSASARKSGEDLADPKDRIELYNEIKLAQFLVAEERIEEAEEKLKSVLGKDASVLEARYILGNIYSRQKKYDLAVEEFQKALAVNPDYYEAIFGTAIAYFRQKKYEEAVFGFKRIMDIDPRDTKPLLFLGDLYEELGEIGEAISYLRTATELDPEAPVFHNKLGALHLKKGQLDIAEKEIKTALGFDRSVPLLNAHFNLALLHEARGQISLAIQEYEKEKETSPYNYRPNFNLGVIYDRTKNVEKAIIEFEECIEKNEEFADAYVFLAKAYMDSRRDLNEAIRLAERGLSLNPELRTRILAHFVLADIYNRQGNHVESQRHLEMSKKLQKSLNN